MTAVDLFIQASVLAEIPVVMPVPCGHCMVLSELYLHPLGSSRARARYIWR
jgi:hypothetical protein